MNGLIDLDPSGRTTGCLKKPGFVECPGTNRFQFELTDGDPGLGAVVIDNTTLVILAFLGWVWWKWFRK
jgi:hypothetical protein